MPLHIHERNSVRNLSEGRRGTSRDDRERGFTLVELLVVVAILPLVVGAISVALLTTLNNSNSTSNTLSSSGDTQVGSAVFVSDVQSASQLTTMPTPVSPTACATAAQTSATGYSHLVSFKWADGTTEISYVEVPQTGGQAVLRNFCQSGNLTPVSTTVVARNVQSVQTVVAGSSCPHTLNPTNNSCPAQTAWTPAAGTAYVKISVTEPTRDASTPYSFSLQAAPRSSNISSSGLSGGGSLPVLLLGTGTNGAAFDDWTCGGKLTVTNGQVVTDSTNGGASNGTLTASGGYYTADTGNPSGAYSGATLNPSGASVVSGPPIPDPYANLTPPAVPGNNGGIVNGVYQPGYYASQLSVSNVTFAPGIYYFQNGVDIGPGTTTGTGVFFYIAGGSFTTHGNADVTLSPLGSPPSPASGLVIWQAGSGTMTLGGTGTATVTISGTVYAPNASVTINGGGKPTKDDLVVGALLAKTVGCSGSHANVTVQNF